MRLRSLVKRPSPAMIVAVAALVMSLSGTTYAVTKLPSRSVGSTQLKKGAVHTENIAKGAVTSSKLALGLTATGAQASRAALRADTSYAVRAGYADRAGHADTATLADQATLATTAGSAATAGSAVSAGSAANADQLDGHDSSYFLSRGTLVQIPRITLNHADEREIWSYGPFTFTARCYLGIGTPVGDEAEVLISTNQPHSAFEGFSSNADLGPSSLEISRSVVSVDGGPGQPQFESSADGTAIAPDGTEIRSIVFYAGVNLFGAPGHCSFGGFAIL
jgi:hypothetical protein